MRFATLLCAAITALAQAPDTILINGKILTADANFSVREALAVRDGKITALGASQEIRATAGPATRVIDLGGRTVIPGLIDSHMHGIRAALSFSSEVNWIGTRSIAEATQRIADAAQRKPAGAWLIVAGGWTPDQFAERRPPTQAELTAAAPNNPVYVQLGYSWAMLTDAGYRKLGINDASQLPQGARFETDANGKRTGAVAGTQPAIVAMFDKLPKPTAEEQLEGTRLFLREMNRLGLTGIVDPGGNNLFPPDYAAIQQVWREEAMTVRIAFALNGQTPGNEFEEFQQLTALLPMGFGDDYLKFNGLGERVTFAVNNNDNPSDEQKEQLLTIARWAAKRGLGLTIHWPNDASVNHLLGIFDAVNRETPIAPLRWSIAHLDTASEPTLRRMQALGVGWTVQNNSYFGARPGTRMPALNTARRLGVHVGAGTDAHRVMSYNPFTALEWLLDGKTVAGAEIGGMNEAPGREDALRLYTIDSAWFSHDDDVRGSLEVGKLADLAVLTADYMTIPVSEVGNLESVLTMVGGKVVYTAAPF